MSCRCTASVCSRTWNGEYLQFGRPVGRGVDANDRGVYVAAGIENGIKGIIWINPI